MARANTLIKRQVRGFVLTWMILTFIITGLTFFGIYLTYTPTQPDPTDLRGSAAFPTVTPPQAVAQVTVPPTIAPTSTPTLPVVPTNTPQPTVAPTETVDAAALAAAAQPTATPVPPTAVPTIVPLNETRFELGIQVQPDNGANAQYQDDWMLMVQNDLSMDWVKLQIRWEYTEPERGVYDWAIVDNAMRSAQKYNLKVLAAIVAAPDWARHTGFIPELNGPPQDTQDFVNFVATLLNRYPGQIQALQVWNEPNIDREWDAPNGLSAQEYTEFLRRTYQGVKAVDPNVMVVSGPLSTTGGGTNPQTGIPFAIDNFAYFDAMIEAGLLEYTDCVGAHHNGYNLAPSIRWDAVPDDPTATFRGPFDNPHHSWSFRSTMEYYANRIGLAGGDQQLCVTELGWASGEDLAGVPAGWDYARDNTLAEQAQWLIEASQLMAESGYVRLAFVWNLNYGPGAGWSAENDNVPYTLIGPDWNRRPAFWALQEWNRRFKGLIQ